MYRPPPVARLIGASSSSDAAVSRFSSIACAYRNGLSVEPAWRGASTASTSRAPDSAPDEPTHARISPLALSITTTAPSCTLRRWAGALSSVSARVSVSRAKRCSGASSVERTCAPAPGFTSAAMRRAKCGASAAPSSRAALAGRAVTSCT